MARLVVAAVVGVVVGYFGGPAAGLQAFSLVYGVTGFLDPKQKVLGPRLQDLKGPSASYGVPIAYVEGAPRLAGCFIWASGKREIATKESQGKGGPGVSSTTFTYEIDVLIELSINPCQAIRRVFSNGKLVWSVADISDDASIRASLVTTAWRDIRFYNGHAEQLPDPVYEAAVGIGNAPAYRGRSTVFVEGLNLGNSGQLPVLTFEVVSEAEIVTTSSNLVTTASVPAGWIGGIPAMTPRGFDYMDAVNSGTDAQINVSRVDRAGRMQIVGVWPAGFPIESSSMHGNSDVTCILFEDKFIVNKYYCFLSEPEYDLGGDFGATLRLAIYDCSSLFGAGLLRPGGRFARRGNTVLIGSKSTTGVVRFDAAGAYKGKLSLGQAVCSVATDEVSGYAVANDRTGVYQFDLATMTLQATLPMPHGGTIADPAIVVNESGQLCMLGAYTTVEAGLTNFAHRWDGAAWVQVFRDIGPVLGTGAGSANHSAADGTFFGQSTPGAPAGMRIDYVLQRVGIVDVALDDAVSRLCLRTGQLSAADIDVTALSEDVVRAMAVSQVSPTRTVLEMLMGAYLFECVENDKLRFVKRGGAPVMTIPFDDLGCSEQGDAEPLPKKRVNDPEIPAQVSVRYANIANDFQDGVESGDRLVTSSTAVSVIELPLGFTAAEAKRLADANTMDLAASLLQVGPIALPRKYSALEPTDVVMLSAADGSAFRARIIKGSIGAAPLEFDLVIDDASVISSSAETDVDYAGSHLVRTLSFTDLALLDIPILRDADDAPGFYAAFDANGLWPGAELDVSPDGNSFSKVLDASDLTVIGLAGAALGNFTGGAVFDELNFLTVDVDDGVLSSISRDQLLSSNDNALLVGSEVVQFRTATLVSPGVYTLSGFLRGRRGTEWAIGGHVANERVVLLQTAGLRRVTDQQADIGIARRWKAVTYSMSRSDAPSATFVDTGVGLKPFSPVDARGSQTTSGNITLTWTRRTRLATRFAGPGGINVPLGEAVEKYEVDVFSDGTYTAAVRTLYASSESVQYDAAQVAADFGIVPATLYVRIYQVSAIVGRGYPLTAALSFSTSTIFVPNTINKEQAVLASSNGRYLAGVHGNGTNAFGLFTWNHGDALMPLAAQIPATATNPYLKELHLWADDGAGGIVVLLRAQANPSGARKLLFGTLPAVQASTPTFMPSNPPIGLWWTGTEFRALLVDGHVWSSATGQTWTDEGASTGGPSSTAASLSGAYVVRIGSVLSMRFGNAVYTSAAVTGLTWTAATGAVASLPVGTYSDYFALYALAVNGSRAVMLGIGKKPGDSASYGLVYTSTDGAAWTLVQETAIAGPNPAYYRASTLNFGLLPFGTGFIADMWPIVGGSTANDVQTLYDFGGGVTARYALTAVSASRTSGAEALVSSSGGSGLATNTFYATTDLVTFTEIDLDV